MKARNNGGWIAFIIHLSKKRHDQIHPAFRYGDVDDGALNFMGVHSYCALWATSNNWI